MLFYKFIPESPDLLQEDRVMSAEYLSTGSSNPGKTRGILIGFF
jgi:hypothetical protein